MMAWLSADVTNIISVLGDNMETTETTITGSKSGIIIGIVSFICFLILAGLFFDTTRVYIVESVKVLLGLIPIVGTLK